MPVLVVLMGEFEMRDDPTNIELLEKMGSYALPAAEILIIDV